MKIVTARLALISIGKIYGGEIFQNSSSNMMIFQNSYFLCCFTFLGLHFGVVFFGGLSMIVGWTSFAGSLSFLGVLVFRVVFIFGVLFFFWVNFYFGVVAVGIRNGIFEEFPSIDYSNWNESQTGSDNFHCPFGSRNPKKIKTETISYVKTWPLTPAIG